MERREEKQEARENVDEWRGWMKRVKGREEGRRKDGKVGEDEGGRGEW